jgi:3-methyl-2-oxobutanoate hydroxymethyltransferase
MITCYDYSFAKILSQTDIDSILVGDSLGMVIQGQDSTLPVTLDEMIYHTKIVKRGAENKKVICDMPFMSYQVSVKQAIKNAGRIMKETRADAVKMEGATEIILEAIYKLQQIGIPVIGHLGLTPQSFQVLGGYKVQGKDEVSANKILEDSIHLEKSGVFGIVLEMLPENLGKKITSQVKIPTIGIGAGRYTDGQVLVLQDMLGMNPDFNPKFLNKFLDLFSLVKNSVDTYHNQVRKSEFPEEKNSFVL